MILLHDGGSGLFTVLCTVGSDADEEKQPHTSMNDTVTSSTSNFQVSLCVLATFLLL